MEAPWPAVAARHLHRLPVRLHPAGGGEIPTFLSYATEKKLSKHQEEFGTVGAIEGVAGPGGGQQRGRDRTLVPLLTLGIPGVGDTTAILLSARSRTTASTRAAAVPERRRWCGR